MTSTLRKIEARKFLRFTTDELIVKLNGDFTLVFEDGEIATNERETIFSSFAWEFHRRWPNTPLLKKHHLKSVLKNGYMQASAHMKLIEAALYSVYDAYQHSYADERDLSDVLAKLAYEQANAIYNKLSIHCEPFVPSLDLMDFIEIAAEPGHVALLEAAAASDRSSERMVEKVHSYAKELIYRDPRFNHNQLAKALRRGNAREGQTLQCVSLRGFLTDMDSHIFPIMVASGHIHGIRTIYESLIESRSAAKSLGNSEQPLQESETFSRRQQLIGLVLRHLVPGDCGSNKFLTLTLRDKRYEGRTMVGESDLATWYGRWYVDEETGDLKVLGKDDTHLIGKTLRFRSHVAGCALKSPYSICTRCYGIGAQAVAKNSNIGHLAVVEMTSVLGQLILSTKHHEGSSSLESIVLTGAEKQYLVAAESSTHFYLNTNLKGKKFKIRIAADYVPGMPDLQLTQDVSSLTCSRISEFSSIVLEIEGNGSSELLPLSVEAHGRNSSLSLAFLQHIKNKDYTIDQGTAKSGRFYVFDMDGWDFTKPAFALPMSHFNMSNHQGEIADILESTMSDMMRRSEAVSPEALLMEFHDLVNRRIRVHSSILETILLGSMVVSALEGNFDIPRSYTRSGMGVMRTLIANRSLSAQMGFQGHRSIFVSPAAFLNKRRLDHPFDTLIMPKLLNDPTYVRRVIENPGLET